MPNMAKLAKNGHFQAISRVPENFWKFPGLMKYWNFALKMKFLDKNWVGKISHILKMVQICQFQGSSGFLEAWNPGLKTSRWSQKCPKMMKICYTNFFCSYILKNYPFLKIFSRSTQKCCKTAPHNSKKYSAELIFKLNFFLAEHESCYFWKVFKVKVALFFWSDEIFTPPPF